MSSTSEHEERLRRELTDVGITPDISRTNGGHMRIRWRAGGNLRSVLTSWTPSDHRSALNARARIRAFLREDGLLGKPKQEPSTLVKALSLPVPREPDNVRISRLENDIAALLDIVNDLTAKMITHGIKLSDDVPALPPTPTYVHAEARPQKKRKVGERGWEHDFLLCVGYQATPFSQIVARAGCTYGNASVRLNVLKKAGLVENTMRGMWRKKATNGNGGAHTARYPEGRVTAS